MTSSTHHALRQGICHICHTPHPPQTLHKRPTFRFGAVFLTFLLVFSGVFVSAARADQVDRDFQMARQQFADEPSLLDRASGGMNQVIDHALGLLGVRYHRGGRSPETGFDCSGFVTHVYRSVGTLLPRSAREISHEGAQVRQNELQPGDLVFFNTMRRAFSHVGIYLGNHQFVHAPASGGEVRIDDLREKYWGKRYNGARRVNAG